MSYTTQLCRPGFVVRAFCRLQIPNLPSGPLGAPCVLNTLLLRPVSIHYSRPTIRQYHEYYLWLILYQALMHEPNDKHIIHYSPVGLLLRSPSLRSTFPDYSFTPVSSDALTKQKPIRSVRHRRPCAHPHPCFLEGAESAHAELQEPSHST